METIHAVFIISETLYAEPSPVDPIEFLPITDMLIGCSCLVWNCGMCDNVSLIIKNW